MCLTVPIKLHQHVGRLSSVLSRIGETSRVQYNKPVLTVLQMRLVGMSEHDDIGFSGSKVDDLPPAKYNPGAVVKNSLVSSGCILNGTVENSVLFKKVYIGNNCIIKNSIILNDVYIGDNTVIENCIVESRDTIRANTTYIGKPDDVKIVIEKNERYTL